MVLVIGSRGREHALCFALQQSQSCDATSVHREMLAFLAREMLLAFQVDVLNSVAVISFFPEAADRTSHGWTRGSSRCRFGK